uniref:Uncharacterized protein n=1 Tax=Rhizophora mucronata TaxID=61149 RepID=A0A2P2NSE7_RHIMU
MDNSVYAIKFRSQSVLEPFLVKGFDICMAILTSCFAFNACLFFTSSGNCFSMFLFFPFKFVSFCLIHTAQCIQV